MLPYQNLSLEDMPGEIWKDISGWGEKYKVSNFGRVKNNTNPNNYGAGYRVYPKILKQHFNQKGYLSVRLYHEGKSSYASVARIVLNAFKPNTEGKPCIDHIDTDKTNNTISNLQWVTYSENMRNPLTMEKRKGMPWLKGVHHTGGLGRKPKPVVSINLLTSEVRRYASTKETEKDGFSSKQVYAVCLKVHKSTKHCVFFYADDPELTAYLTSLREFQVH